MIEKWNFLKFKKWGEIQVFFGSSRGHACFWAINECRLAAWAVWVKGARKKWCKKCAKRCGKLTKVITKRALFVQNVAEI
jgi:hypothetical protein